MRSILLAVIALACAVPTAEAARREEARQTASRQQASAPVQRSATQARPATTRQQATRPATTRQQVTQRQGNLRPGDVRTQRDGIVVRGAAAATISRGAVAPRNAMASNCTRRNGRTECGPARSSVAGWQRGLPTPDYAQRECPEGTFATFARGHDDVVRCMPL